VVVVVSGLGVLRAMTYLSTRAQANHELAVVRSLTKDNARLAGIQRSLSQPGTIAADARKLGMVMPGEHPYAVTSGNR